MSTQGEPAAAAAPSPIERISAALAAVEALPASSGAVRTALRFADDETHVQGDLVQALLADPTLTARVLRAANAAAVGGGSVQRLSHAVALLGVDTVRTLALSMALADNIESGEHRDLVMLELSLSVAASCAAREIAATCGQPPEVAAVLALMRCTGRLAVAAWAPQAYLAIRERAMASGRTEAAAAREVLGCDFGEVSRMALRAWGLPEAMQQAAARAIERCEDAEAVAAVAAVAAEAAMQNGALDCATAITAAHKRLSRSADATTLGAALARAQHRYHDIARTLEVPDVTAAEVHIVVAGAEQDLARAGAATPTAARDEAGRPEDYRERLAAAAGGLTQAALSGASRAAILEMAVASMHDAMGFARTIAMLREASSGALRVATARGSRLTAELSTWRLAPGGSDLINAALARDVSLNIADATVPKIRAALPAGIVRALPAAASFIMLPMRDQGATVGLLYGDRLTPDRLTNAEDVALLAGLRNQLLLAMRVAKR